MTERTIYHMGGRVSLSKLVSHYRAMMRREPRSAGFWRDRLRVVIDQARFEAAGDRIAA